MKNKNIFWLCLAFTLCLSACVGMGTAVPYSFAESESAGGTAIINFVGAENGVDLYFFENKELPVPEDGKYWKPVTFPAGRPFTITVNVYASVSDHGNRYVFNCPALRAGRTYTLAREVQRVLGFQAGKAKLVLREGGKRGRVVHEQEI